jgi:hypothetical protein
MAGLQTFVEEAIANNRRSTITADTTASGDKTIPTYASACSSPAGYASACSCYGITSHAVTKTDQV